MKYKYLTTGDILMYTNRGPEGTVIGKIEEVVIAECDDDACDLLVQKFMKEYGRMDNTDIDNVHCKCIGPADLVLFVKADAYLPCINETLTVGELIEYLGDFNKDSKLYLADYTGTVPIYGGIDWGDIDYIDKE